jgi:hypothetical protein
LPADYKFRGATGGATMRHRHLAVRGFAERIKLNIVFACMVRFLLWCILLVLCWPLAFVALVV